MVREYTPKEQKELRANPYTLKVTQKTIMFTADFKREFWSRYQAGTAPRTILKELGYDVNLFGQKKIDGLVQRIKKQAEAGKFTEGSGRERRPGMKIEEKQPELLVPSEENMGRLWHELQYLRQEVDFIKKVRPAAEEKKVTP